MSKYRKVRDKRDLTHQAIVGCLRSHGYEVTETERPVDIYIYDHQAKRGGWGEIKDTRRNAMTQRGQLEWMSETDQEVSIITTEGEALIFASDFKGWSRAQKDAIAGLLVRNPAKQFHPRLIEDALNGLPPGSVSSRTSIRIR